VNCWGKEPATHWFLLPRAADLVNSGELASDERLEVAEYGLTPVLITFWWQHQDPADSSESRGRGPAWDATTEFSVLPNRDVADDENRAITPHPPRRWKRPQDCADPAPVGFGSRPTRPRPVLKTVSSGLLCAPCIDSI
jgi:hypothetical protein